MRKVLKNFEIFYQPDGLVGKPNQPVHWVPFVGTVVWVLCFVCVGSWSFGVKIPIRLFFWILNSVKKVLKSFEIFSQPDGLVGKPNQPVHWVLFSGTTAWVLYFVCVGSWSFEVQIELRLFFSILDYLCKDMKSFEIFSQSDGPVGKPNQPVH